MKDEVNRKYKDLSKNMILFTISSFGSKIISFLLVPLYTSILSTNEYGTVDLLTTTAALLIPILTIDIQDAVLRFALDRKYKPKDVISIGFRINFFASGILLIALMILQLSGILNLGIGLLSFLFLNFVFGGFNNCFTLYLKGIERISILVASGLTNTLVTCSLNIYLLLFARMGLMGYLIANIAGQGIAVCIQFFGAKIYKDINFKTDKTITREMAAYSSPLIMNSISWWINSSSDRYILVLLRSVAENGIFSVAYKIPTILSTIQTIFYNAWSISAITEYDNEDRDGFIGNTYTLYSVLSIVSCSIIMFFNRPLAKILYANDFYQAWQAVPFLLVGTVFNGISVFQGCLFAAIKQTKEVSKSTIIGALTNIICNFVCVYFFGVIGAAFATMFGYMIVWIMRTFKLNQFIHMRVNRRLHYLSCILLIVQAFMALSEKMVIMEGIIVIILVLLQKDHIKVIVRKVRTMIWNRR